MKKIRVCVVTGSRSDYGLLRWLMQEFKSSSRFDLKVAATGAHFSPDYGFTYKEIEKDGFKIAGVVKANFNTRSAISLVGAVGAWTQKFGKLFEKMRPDLVVVMGDRYELLSVGAACVVMGIPIAHVSGGEITEGAIDEQIRHAMTKMAHLHFAANKTYAGNVRRMGEESWRVSISGEPGLDNIRRLKLMTRGELEKNLKINLSKKTALVTYHPVTLEPRLVARQMDALLSALAASKLQCVVTYPNADLGSREIILKLEAFAKKNAERVRLMKSLGQIRYLSLLKHAHVQIGNSSSGLVEAPSFNLPVVNIGARQEGRMKAKNVIDAACETSAILKGIKKALAYNRSKKIVNPYGDGRSSQRICAFIQKIWSQKSKEQIMRKRFAR